MGRNAIILQKLHVLKHKPSTIKKRLQTTVIIKYTLVFKYYMINLINSNLNFILFIIFVFIFNFFLINFFLKTLKIKKLIDFPDEERKIHKQPVQKLVVL